MDGIDVQISNRQTALEVDEELLRLAVVQTLAEEGVAPAEVSVAILDDSQIRPVNRDHLGHDEATDTISFRLDGPAEDPDGSDPTLRLVGEILVSAETALRAARAAEWPAMHELLLYVIHATLHLTGHDDHQPAARQRMRQRERDILRQLNIAMPPTAEVDVHSAAGPRSHSGTSTGDS